jgi:hypothetical protein
MFEYIAVFIAIAIYPTFGPLFKKTPLSRMDELFDLLSKTITFPDSLKYCTGVVPIEFIGRHSTWFWNMAELSKHPELTMDFIRQHPDMRWMFNFILANQNIPLKDMEPYLPFISTFSFVHKDLTIEFAQSHPECKWNWFLIANKDLEPYKIVKE